ATAAFNYLLPTDGAGTFSFDGNYTRILNHDRIVYEGDPVLDYLDDPYYSGDPADRATLSGSWKRGKWSSTLYANWMGATPNYRALVSASGYDAEGAAKLGSFTTYNASVSYRPIEDLELSFLVNNLTNEMPPEDPTFPGTSGAPYNESNYSVYGRSMYIEARYNFGR